MKNLYFLLTVLLLSFSDLSAQESGKFRIGLNGGYALPEGGSGFSGNLDFRYNAFDKLNIGFIAGYQNMTKNFEKTEGRDIKMTGFSVMLISNYYFKFGDGIFAPYIGGAIGYINTQNKPQYLSEGVKIKSTRLGGLIHAGIEIWQIRLGIEYNIIPKTPVRDLSNNIVDHIKNNYFNIYLGFYLGGRN